MALSPEDVIKKSFGPTHLRRGYDETQVDDFLDEVVVELRRLRTENDGLRSDLADCRASRGLGGDEAAMQMMMSMPEMGELEMITVDGELYLAMPGVTPEGMYMQAGEDLLGQAAAMEDIDVSTQWEAWEEGAEQVVFLGDEDVDGTEMGHYQVTVDPQAIAEAGGEDAAAMTQAVGDEPVVYDVWLDDDNLMRQLSFELEGMTAEMMMDNWGEPQEIEAPPADQVMDMGDLGGTPTTDG